MRQCFLHPNVAEHSNLRSLWAWYLAEHQRSHSYRAIGLLKSHKSRKASKLWCSAVREQRSAAESDVASNTEASSRTPNETIVSRHADSEQRQSLRRPSRSSRHSDNGGVGSSRHANPEAPFGSVVLGLEQAIEAGEGGQAYQRFRDLQRLEPGILPKAELCNRLLKRKLAAFSRGASKD